MRKFYFRKSTFTKNEFSTWKLCFCDWPVRSMWLLDQSFMVAILCRVYDHWKCDFSSKITANVVVKLNLHLQHRSVLEATLLTCNFHPLTFKSLAQLQVSFLCVIGFTYLITYGGRNCLLWWCVEKSGFSVPQCDTISGAAQFGGMFGRRVTNSATSAAVSYDANSHQPAVVSWSYQPRKSRVTTGWAWPRRRVSDAW